MIAMIGRALDRPWSVRAGLILRSREIGPVPILSNDGTTRNHYSSELIIRLILRTGIRRKAAYTVTAMLWFAKRQRT
jgi:hypothetical protein